MNGYGRLEPLEYDVAVLVDATTRRLEAGHRLPPVTHHETTYGISHPALD